MPSDPVDGWDGLEIIDDFFIIGAGIVEMISGNKKIHDSDCGGICHVLVWIGTVFAGIATFIATVLLLFEIQLICGKKIYGKEIFEKPANYRCTKIILKILKAVLTFFTLLFFLIAPCFK